ncbi:hypothetical protein JP75_14150 [Devosia riboflavina]|jgi:hypothetical protein|uniref:Uncharacterized protein n=1 Tax=Devosia riboflavina TaxID=46914 RepID=A0A087M163_9HYPH|nr:hypothetical protein JP75_14150 [Devosia riboflavina]
MRPYRGYGFVPDVSGVIARLIEMRVGVDLPTVARSILNETGGRSCQPITMRMTTIMAMKT